MIEVREVNKFYGKFQALYNVSFKANKGEILGFLGPNGAGKTTTMRIITGFMPPSSGDCIVEEISILKNPIEVKKKIGYLPENPPLYTEFTVKEYLYFVGKLKGLSKSEVNKRIDEIVEKCGIDNVYNKVISKLSKGYRQRVGIAQALLHDPKVIILDEPTIGLDPVQIREIRNLIKGLGGDHTVILSSHILPEVSQVCDRILIINKGKIVAEDTPENLTKKLEGQTKCTLILRGERNKIEEIISKYVEDLEISGNEELKINFELKSEEDLRPKIIREVIDVGGADVYEFSTEKLTLEDIFLHLVTEENEGRQ